MSRMQVPYLDLPSQFADPELFSALQRQLAACSFVLGPEAERFEAAFADLCGTTYALGLNSGTDAIFLALKALGVGPGDEVITAPNSFVATAGAIAAAGARPVFVDVGPDYNLDPDLLEAAITARSKVILPVHLTGKLADMPRIMEIATRLGLQVVEDAAQAVRAELKGCRAGAWGAAGCFSLHPLKNLNVAGDGGMLTTNDPALYATVKKLRNHGLRNRDEVEFFGFNSRLDNLQAVVGLHRLDKLEEVTARRRANAALYDQLLAGLVPQVVVPPRAPEHFQVFHTYVIQVERREELRAYLAQQGVETKIHYPIPIHLQLPCREMGYQEGDFPVCESQARRILTLPVHQHLRPEQVRYVADQIAQFYRAA